MWFSEQLVLVISLHGSFKINSPIGPIFFVSQVVSKSVGFDVVLSHVISKFIQ